MSNQPPPLPKQANQPLPSEAKKGNGCLIASLLFVGFSILFVGGPYLWLKKSGTLENLGKLSGFIADQVKQENENARIEQERRANLTPDERAREDAIELEKKRIELELANERSKNIALSGKEDIAESLKTTAQMLDKVIEAQKLENERRASLSKEERAREDELRANVQQNAMNALSKLGDYTAEQIKHEREEERLERERRAKLTPAERAREDAIELEKLKIQNR